MSDHYSFLGKLANRYTLDELAVGRLARLTEWSLSLEISGTAVSSLDEALDAHIADSLSGMEVEAIREAESLVDVGTGVGFPGIVLAIVLPDLRVTLLDSVRKKMDAAAEITQELGLSNIECVWSRVEDFGAIGGPARESFDVVTARALATLNVIVEYSAPLLKVGGSLVAWKGAPSEQELADAAFAEIQLGFATGQLIRSRPFARSQRRHFYVTKKLQPVSEQFPRRAGVSLKRPIVLPSS